MKSLLKKIQKFIVAPTGNSPTATYIRMMTQFPSLYPNSEVAEINVFGSCNYKWKGADIVSTDLSEMRRDIEKTVAATIGVHGGYSDAKTIAEYNATIKFRKYNGVCLHGSGNGIHTSFHADSESPLKSFIEEDNIHPSPDWLHEIGMFCFRINKLEAELIRRAAQVQVEFNGTCEPYAKYEVDRKVDDFIKFKELTLLGEIRCDEESRKRKDEISEHYFKIVKLAEDAASEEKDKIHKIIEEFYKIS